jgi:predicted ester cyclase
VTILRNWSEQVWNQGNECAIDNLMAPDASLHHLLGPDGDEVTDRPAFKKMFRAIRSALSDLQLTIECEITQGDLSAALCTITAVHTGDGLGKPPQSRPIHFTGMLMARVRHGQIVETWNYFDFETMYQQME